MKHAIMLFWKGLTGIFAAVANWITTILGMNDNSKYGKILRRIVGTCFTILFLVGTIGVLDNWMGNIFRNWSWFDDDYIASYDNQYIARGIYYHADDSGNGGYVFSSDGKKLIKGIQWLSKPLGKDSLVVFSDGKKRGYFNMFTGKVVIKPIYKRAWVFSDGMASVEIDGMIKFINTRGDVVLDPQLPFRYGMEGYVFHNGLCIVENKQGNRRGIIDKQGNYVLQPEYVQVDVTDSLYVIGKENVQSVIDARLKPVIPFMQAKFYVYEDKIEAVKPDHSVSTYTRNGELLDDFIVTNTEQLLYDTNDVRYCTSYEYDDNGHITKEVNDGEQFTRQAVAYCLKYQAEYGWYGLMAKDGTIITPPAYRDIKALASDVYLCSDERGNGVLLNGKGRKVK